MKNVVIIGLFGLALIAGTSYVLPYFETLPQLADTPVTRPVEKQAVAPSGAAEEVTNVNLLSLDLKSAQVVTLTTEVNMTSAKAVVDGIYKGNQLKKPIYLLLDSPGGSVIDGAHIISAMQASKQPVYTVCLEMCASMAAMILEYGTKRYAIDRSIIMFHPASLGGFFQGELDKIVSRFSFLKRYIDKMDYYVAQRSGTTYEAFKAKSSREYWIDAEDALNNGIIDNIVRLDDYQGVPQPRTAEGRNSLQIEQLQWNN